MILEGLATTVSPAGEWNLAPLGAIWPDGAAEGNGFALRPFGGSATCRNLLATGRGVWHVTDDAALVARCAAGSAGLSDVRALPAGDLVRLADCCRWLAFEVTEARGPDDRGRYDLAAAVRDRGEVRPCGGLNRAAFALVEGAILATRTFLMSRTELNRRLADLAPLVAKTGAADQRRAWGELTAAVAARPAADEPA